MVLLQEKHIEYSSVFCLIVYQNNENYSFYCQTNIKIRGDLRLFQLIFVILQGKRILNMANKDINRIKVVLVDKKKTNKWLAEQLGKDQTTISKWCTNTSQPDLGSLMKIAKLLGVELSELVRFEQIQADEIDNNIQ